MDAFFRCVYPLLHTFCGKRENLYNLEHNLGDLQKYMRELNATRDDILGRISRQRGRVLPEVNVWKSEVEDTQLEANILLDKSIYEIRRLSMYDYCSPISSSTYTYSEKVVATLEKIRDLRSKGVFEVVVDPASQMEEMPVIQPIVSQRELLERSWDCLMEYDVGTLGIYGMGGVGKTTLLKLINNNFSQVGRDAFDLVIYVVVGNHHKVRDIQDKIGTSVGLPLHWGRETKEEKAAEIFSVLKRKRFVLLLDDIWKRVDLVEIGVPFPTRENGCKVVFTTRHRGSINCVDAEFEVPVLSSYEAWELFQKKVGIATLTSHPEIPKLAKLVAAKCGGLPLALSVLGESMSCKRTVQGWRYAVHVLNSSRAYNAAFEVDILSILKLSYDDLCGAEIRLCFLYCALFPENYYISSQDLINYWVGEALISDENHGYEIIGELVRACLLMEDKSGEGVKMHDIVREMALWIASDLGKHKENFVVVDGEGIQEMPRVEDWRMVTRMSVTSTQIVSISISPDYCPRLTTLFLQRNSNLKWISTDFFLCISYLIVLDLSHNREFSKLPEEISNLVALRYLSLSGTGIKDLPHGFGKLTRLIHLDLERTPNLRSIILVSGLLKLQVLKFYGSAAALDLSLLKKLERLENLKSLTISVTDVDVLEAFLGSKKLARCTQGLYLQGLDVSGVSGKPFAATFGVLNSLSKLEIVECNIIERDAGWEDNRRNQDSPSTSSNPSNTWFKKLSTVVLLSCVGLKDVTWLIYAEVLESLTIQASPKMEELINKEKAVGVDVEPFLKLQVLELGLLDELRSIYWSPLSFPSLQKVYIEHCPNLHKLPFNYMSVERIDDLRIQVDNEWIQNAEWVNEDTRQRFLPAIRTVSLSQHHPVIEEENTDSFMIGARQIEITHAEKPENWTWSSIYEASNQVGIQIATMKEVYWMDIRGSYSTRKLKPETKYEVVFVVKLEATAIGWHEPVNLSLKISVRGQNEIVQEQTSSLEDIATSGWVDVKVGEFVAPPNAATKIITFTMYQHDSSFKKTGLVVKGVAIRPMD